MSHDQWEEIMVYGCRAPACSEGVVAFGAIRGKASGHMVRASCCHVISLVTIDAIIPKPLECERISSTMTIHTAQCDVHTHQRESILFMDLRNIVHQPALWCVATHAIIANTLAVNISMTGDTVARG